MGRMVVNAPPDLRAPLSRLCLGQTECAGSMVTITIASMDPHLMRHPDEVANAGCASDCAGATPTWVGLHGIHYVPAWLAETWAIALPDTLS